MIRTNDLENIVARITRASKVKPEIAIVLGSGLGALAEELDDAVRISTSSLPGYPQSTVEGHKGFIVTGHLSGKPVVCFQGRVHFYEGYSVEQVVLPVRLAFELGARKLILTNAAGGISPHLQPGSLMLITDHIDFQFRRKIMTGSSVRSNSNYLRSNWHERGSVYSQKLIDIATEAALRLNIRLFPGVLGALLGPTYETPAEVRMQRVMGVDAACMSTVAEAAESVRLDMEVMGISCITNRAAGLPGSSLDHEDVIRVADRVRSQFIALIRGIIQQI